MLIDGCFSQLKKTLTNQSFVGGDINFLQSELATLRKVMSEKEIDTAAEVGSQLIDINIDTLKF